MVGELDAPQLHVVFGRNADLGVGLQPRLILAKLGPRLGEDASWRFAARRAG